MEEATDSSSEGPMFPIRRPEADVWLLYGEGSVGFSMSELDTFVRHDVAVISVVGNDAGWTQIARDQVEIPDSAAGTELRHTDYHVVAKGWGAKGYQIADAKSVDRMRWSSPRRTTRALRCW